MKICLNPLCSAELPVNKKSPGQKYCNKICWAEHREYLRTECSKKCENPACDNIIKHKKESVRKFCSNSCSAIVTNTIPKKSRITNIKILNRASTVYFSIKINDVTNLHIDKVLDDILIYRTVYKLSLKKIAKIIHDTQSFYNFLTKNYKSIPIRKPKQVKKKKDIHPFSKVYKCSCKIQSCDNIFYTEFPRKFCKDHTNFYTEKLRGKYGFKFNIFDFPDLFDLDLLKEKGFYHSGNIKGKPKNLDGLSRDHKISVADARKYNYDPYYISHAMNCDLISQSKNSSKGTKSSITYSELVELVNEYDKRVA